MNFFYANGTPIINSLKVTSEVPLDPRLTVENIAERDSLVTNHISYDRMKVYVKSNDTKYIYHKDTGEWEIDNKFSEEDKSKLDRIDNYLIDTEHIYNPENKLLYREHSYDPNTDITTLRDHILQEARVSENGELYNGLLSKFYVNRLNNITNYLIDVSFTKGTDVPNLYLTTHSYNPDEDRTTLTNIDIPLATDDNHGLLSNLQNIKVNRIVDYVNRIDTTHTNAPDTGLTYNYNIYNPFTNANVTKTILIPLVTHTENGLTSSSDKIKIDDIETYVKSIALRQASGTEELGINYIITNPNDQTDTPGYFNIPLVTDSRNGLVSPARKHWMDNASGVSNTGTTSDTWQLDKKDIDTRLDPNGGVIIKDSGGVAEIRNSTDSAYSDLTLNNITIKGDVTQEGRSFITEAETVEVRDNTLLLNRGETGAGVSKEFAGIEIDRGSEPKYQILFDESDDRFKVGVEGDLWNLALRESDDNMLDGYFISWNSKDKILSTTNIVKESTPLLFGRTNYKQYSGNRTDPDGNYSSYAFISEAEGGHLYNFSGSSNWNIDTDKINFRFWKPLLGTTFKRASDNSEVLYHADIVNNLTSGGTNKVLSAEQGKLLQNSITSIQGSYLPLSGGTMTGSINLPSTDPLKMIISGSVDSVLSYWPSNNAIEFGNNKRKIFLRTDNSNIIHYINGSSYSIYDAYNLPDPVTLSGNNTFTGNNTFQAGKFNVGPFEVTSSGSLLLNINLQEGSAWSRSLIFRANSDNTSKSIFGGYNSINNTNLGYAYIGIGDVNHSTAQYKFYANSLRVPYQWSIDGPDGAAIIWSQTSEIVNLGRAAGTTKIRSGNTDLIHTKGSTEYIIWDKSNLPTPATSTDLANYLPLAGGTLTGQLTIKQSIDIKLRLQSTDADNHCIIQAINAQASQLGVFGYAGDKWAIGHNGTYYEIWDKYNLTNPVRYALDDSNYPTLLDSNGSKFSYIKAGTNGLLPHSKVTLANGGAGFLGTSDQSFNAAYINHLYTNKISFGVNGPYIIGSTSATQFLDANGGVQKVATGGLYVGVSYASDALNLVPTNGIYSKGNIRTSGWLTFEDNEWTDTGWTYKDAKGSIKVLSVINETNNKPTSYGSVLQFNSRQGHWCTQIWCDQTNAAGVIGTLRFRTTKSYASTEWNPWTALVTTSDLGNYLPLTGGTLSGNLTINTVGSTTLVINNNDTNRSETFMRVLRKGTAAAAIGFKDSLGAYIYNYNSNKYLFIGNDGYARVGTTSGSTRLALITDIPTVSGYLPLTGGTLTGTLSINSGGSEPLIINNSASAGEAYVVTKTQGTTRGVMGWNSSLGMFLQDNRGYTFSVKADGVYFGASSSTLTKLPTSTDLSGYLPLAGGTMTGALTMSSRRHGVVIDVIGGAGNTWDEGVGALSVQVPNDAGQTPLLLARRSGAAIDTTTAAERLLSMELLDNGHYFIIGMSGSKALQLDWTSGKAGTGKLFGKTIATTDQIPSIPSISISNSGSGNAVTAISASGHTLTVTKGATYLTSSSLDGYATQTWVNNKGYLTSHQTIYNLTFQAGTFSAKTFDPNGAAATVNIPTSTSHLTNDSGFITSSALSGYATQSWANSQFAPLSRFNTSTGYTTIKVTGQEFNFDSANPEIFMNYRTLSGSTAVTKITWKGGSSTTLCEGRWGNLYMNDNLVATQSWAAEKFPNKTGAGASGTWGISITGNAATATTATKWNGYSIWTGTEDELPSSRDANTLYFVKKSS